MTITKQLTLIIDEDYLLSHIMLLIIIIKIALGMDTHTNTHIMTSQTNVNLKPHRHMPS